MSQSSSNSSEREFPLKTRKEELPTRHPTTVKKQELSASSFRRTYYRPNRSQAKDLSPCRSNRSHSLRQSLWTLVGEKHRCMQSGRYGRAMTLESQIRHTRSVLNQQQIKHLRSSHKRQKSSIRDAYKHEVHFFKNAWSNYFERFKNYEKTKLTQFKEQQNQEIDFIRQKLRKKCNTLRHPNRNVIDLQKEQRHHIKNGNIAELVLVRKQKKKLIQNIKHQRRQLINKWMHIEGQQLQKFQSKRYSILINRIQEKKHDQQLQYQSEKKRLRQKYVNVLNQLQHEQKMTQQFVSKRQGRKSTM